MIWTRKAIIQRAARLIRKAYTARDILMRSPEPDAGAVSMRSELLAVVRRCVGYSGVFGHHGSFVSPPNTLISRPPQYDTATTTLQHSHVDTERHTV